MGRGVKLWRGGPIAYEGRTDLPGGVSVDAPYISLSPVHGKPLIIDMQGEFPLGCDQFLEAIRH